MYGDPVLTPSVCVVAIVKNEGKVIERMLQSAKDAGATYYCIVDTGSTDDTWDRIFKFDMPGRLARSDWVNFGHNRTEALQLASVSRCDWYLLLDADETVEGKLEEPTADQGMVEFINGNLMYRRPLLVRASLPWEYVGALHEYLHCVRPFTSQLVEGFTVSANNDGGARRTSADDLALLLAEYRKDPLNPRTVFYLAQTYKDLGDKVKAATFYRLRVDMGSFDEEIFYSWFQLGWMTGIPEHFLTAWNLRPQRMEPLHALAWHYRLKDKPNLAYLYAKHAMHWAWEEPNDRLFIHRDVYQWGIQLEFSIACANTGRYARAQGVNEVLLAYEELPEDIREMVEHNQQWVLGQLHAA